MKSFVIEYKDDRFERAKLIYDILENALEDDESWHFFNEAELGIFLRCDEEFVPEVETYLNSINVKYTIENYDKDENQLVALFQHLFIDYFHCNSMLAMLFVHKILNSNESIDGHKGWFLENVTERVVHSLLNNSQFMAEDSFIKVATDQFGEPEVWESFLLSDIVINRSMYGGIRNQYKKYLKSKNGE